MPWRSETVPMCTLTHKRGRCLSGMNTCCYHDNLNIGSRSKIFCIRQRDACKIIALQNKLEQSDTPNSKEQKNVTRTKEENSELALILEERVAEERLAKNRKEHASLMLRTSISLEKNHFRKYVKSPVWQEKMLKERSLAPIFCVLWNASLLQAKGLVSISFETS